MHFSSFRSLDHFNGFGILTGTCICSGNENYKAFRRTLGKLKSFIMYFLNFSRIRIAKSVINPDQTAGMKEKKKSML